MMKIDRNAPRHLVALAMSLMLLLATAWPAAAATAFGQGAGQHELERTLPLGHGPYFYWEALEDLGYRVKDIEYVEDRHVVFDVYKDHELFMVKLELGDDAGRVTEIDVTILDAGVAHEDDIVTAGTRVPVTMDSYLGSAWSNKGDTFEMTVSETVDIDLPAGTVIEGVVVAAEEAERPHRAGKLVLEARSVRMPRANVPIDAVITAEGDEAEEGILEELGDFRDVGIGAAVGAAIGGLIKGTKGALVGLIIGGTGTFLATKGEDVEIPDGTPLIVELSNDLAIR